MNKQEAAYAAGIIDGEGYIGIVKRAGRKGSHTPIYIPVISVAMITVEAVKWLHSKFGGSFWHGKRSRSNYTEEIYAWRLEHRKTAPCLNTILPYLKLKGKIKRAKACLKLGTLLTSQGLAVPKSNIAKREQLYQSCLKRRKSI